MDTSFERGDPMYMRDFLSQKSLAAVISRIHRVNPGVYLPV